MNLIIQGKVNMQGAFEASYGVFVSTFLECGSHLGGVPAPWMGPPHCLEKQVVPSIHSRSCYTTSCWGLAWSFIPALTRVRMSYTQGKRICILLAGLARFLIGGIPVSIDGVSAIRFVVFHVYRSSILCQKICVPLLVCAFAVVSVVTALTELRDSGKRRSDAADARWTGHKAVAPMIPSRQNQRCSRD